MSEDSSLPSWQHFIYKINGKVESSSKTLMCMSIFCSLIKISTIGTLSFLSVHHIIMGPWNSYLRNNTVIRQNKINIEGKVLMTLSQLCFTYLNLSTFHLTSYRFKTKYSLASNFSGEHASLCKCDKISTIYGCSRNQISPN